MMASKNDDAAASKGSTEEFWEAFYKAGAPRSSGRPSAIVLRFATDLAPGRALDLGCARGDDSVWLAKRGWAVTAVDVAPSVLQYAASNAEREGVAERIRFEKLDLGQTFPGGNFDLVMALFLQSPVEFPREQVLRSAAKAVVQNGVLLIAEHASRAPWSWASPETRHPKVEETLSALQLSPGDWSQEFIGSPERQAQGPNGQTAIVKDNILVLRRRR